MERHAESGELPGGAAKLFGSGNFRRLWVLGGIVNAMRWVEMLAAALFTFEVTGSGFAVALVAAARSLPLLCFGAVAGVVCESVNRKHILLGGMLLSGMAALGICVLEGAGWVRPWHVAVAGFLSGSVWATELAARRRMVGECAGAGLVSRAVALDSLTNSFARMAGPLLGSLLFAHFGLLGAFAVSALCYMLGALLVLGIRHAQETRALVLSRVPSELAESVAYALEQPAVLVVLGVTATLNLFAFSYIALVAPLAQLVFGVSSAQVGLLAAGEALGGLLGGLLLARQTPGFSPRALLIAGSALFLGSLVAMPVMSSYTLACATLIGGGLGLALFSNMQTTLVLTGVPARFRSRQMGLITVCIGFGPVGQVLIGLLAEGFGPAQAVIISALLGLAALGIIALLCARDRPDLMPPGAA